MAASTLFVVGLPFNAVVGGGRSDTGASGQMPESSPPVVRKSILSRDKVHMGHHNLMLEIIVSMTSEEKD